MKIRLPLLLERAVREAESNRHVIASDFESKLRLRLIEGKNAVTCHKGCSHCCYYPLMVSALEGVSLFRWLTERGLWRRDLQDKFKEAHRHVWGLSPSVWLLSRTPCPLLTEQGHCGAYEGRPFVCRTTVSTGDPFYCDPHRFAEGRAGIVPRKEADEALHTVENRLLKSTKMTLLRMPIATAVLMGEKLCKEGLEPEEVTEQLFEEWVRSC